jgi:hypothetical protein
LIVGTVYLLHFSRRYKHARHYVGFTTDLPRRLRQHRGGHGTPLIRHAVEGGGGFPFAQQREQLWRRTRIGAVVESQGDAFF